jgi:hypothetical protein
MCSELMHRKEVMKISQFPQRIKISQCEQRLIQKLDGEAVGLVSFHGIL